MKSLNRGRPVLAKQVLTAPGIRRFHNPNLVSAMLQLGHNPTQEVGIAMIPV
ncbi:MAG TPA: hypothetical protein VHH32_00970 [Gemmatimonadales bacterium]|nr:hypothetical protein [Gemmatimonadales bacterium]